jgi:endonuclease YncB( thermonuclease family)
VEQRNSDSVKGMTIFTKRTSPTCPCWLRAFVVAFFLAAFASGPIAKELSGRIVRVADGDTVTVLDRAKVQHRVRLAGIDAPERAQPYGARAKDHLAALVAGRQVVVEWQKQDRYGRIVGKVLLSGRDINLAMIDAGLAWHYKEYAPEQL